jgi:phosphohistidine phosphatase
MGERLFGLGIRPELLISSPARRARSTAKRLAKKINYPKDRIRIADEFYHGDMHQMLGKLHSLQNETGSVMFFGHNPGLTEFANALCGINIYNIPTCGIVSIEFDVKDWKQVDYNKGKLVFFDYPKKSAAS